jgi:glutathione S-transferase
LSTGCYILGEALSLLDIAWYVYTYRLNLGGYPFERLHPNVARWFAGLDTRTEFRREVTLPPEMIPVHQAAKARQLETGTTMTAIVGI